jgi:hypothetical protein
MKDISVIIVFLLYLKHHFIHLLFFQIMLHLNLHVIMYSKGHAVA